MKKEKRGIFLVLASELDFTICSFCKYSEAVSGYSPCDAGEPYCIHPLGYRLEDSFNGYDIEPGQDCWGFRASHSVEFCADIVGICLANKWEAAVWWPNKKGIWKITESEGY